MTKLGFLSILFTIFSFVQVFAQDATLTGTVVNMDGQPIENATIDLSGVGFSDRITNSNKNGFYSIKVPSEKEITVKITHVGYWGDSFKITIKKDQTEHRTTTLESKSQTTGTIEFTYEKAKVNKGEIKIETKHFDQQLTNENAEGILATLPSVSQGNEMSSQYSVRGGNFDENLIYVNDIEVYRPFLVRSGQQEGLSFINPDLVQSLTFSAGGFAPKYGDKLSSVLDIKYKIPDTMKLSATASILGARFHFENRINRFDILMGARYKSNAYLLGSLDTDGEYKPRFLDYQMYTRYRVTDAWTLSFLGNIAENKYHMEPVSRSTNFGTFQQGINLKVYFDGQEKDEFKTYFGALTSNHLIHDSLSIKFIFSAYQSLESETFDIAGAYRLSDLETNFGDENFGETTYSFGAGALLEHSRNYLQANVMSLTFRANHTFKKSEMVWGAKVQHEEIFDQLSEWTLIDSSGYSIPQAPSDEIQLSEVLKTTINLVSNRIMGFYQFDHKLKKDSTYITMGIRANYWDYNNQLIVSPRFIFSHTPKLKKEDRLVNLRFATGLYQQPPFYRELRNFEGVLNPELRAQTSIHFVGGVDYYFDMWGKEFKWTGDIYYKHLMNLVPYEVDNVRIRYYAENSSKGYAMGAETQIHGDFVPGLESWFSLGVMQTKEDLSNDSYYLYFTDTGDTLLAPNSISTVVDSAQQFPGYIARPTDQRVNIGIYFQDEMPSWPALKMHLSLLYGSRLPYGAPGTPKHLHQLRMPSYRRVDIGFSYQVVRNGKMYKKGKLEEIEKHSFLSHFNTLYIKMDVFNLLAIQNTISYFWVDDIYGNKYGVPNYLTNRLVNLKLIAKF